ncbi:chromatin assembly factor 1 subunit B [Metschnikowia aff. pulcherrima]|uniref:Chromatin assembly factor 1 subunit B n=1 Tax=Metschnikowia aff. pulcherrima TaxID=2163413 RepID=A0A4P6XF81_9ASCO|nr:chromatin assembly factor 1 subunit B [Metschnikowia aff. pulcherrima]
MFSTTIAIHWHDDGQPIYSLDYQVSQGESRRLATAGGDNNVRIWKVTNIDPKEPLKPSVEYLSTLRKHSQAVNTVRFNSSGEFLASAGDDGNLIIWSLANNITQEFGVQDDDLKESWTVHQLHNTNLEIYDMCWSPCSKFIAIGSMDNTTKIFNVVTSQKVLELQNHTHYVQGIAWDPLNEYLATQSADRSVSIHHLLVPKSGETLSAQLCIRLTRADLALTKVSALRENSGTCLFKGASSEAEGEEASNDKNLQESTTHTETSRNLYAKERLPKRVSHLYHSENLQSFFRRLAFSPDGSLLIAPLGVFKYDSRKDSAPEGAVESNLTNTVYIYTRAGFSQPPICHLPGLMKPAIAVAFNPIQYELTDGSASSIFALPYKLVFAVATHDAVIVYDTERLQPLGMLTNLHYLTITDLCWNKDGKNLMISSAEGFCSLIVFESSVFGTAYNSARQTEEPPSHFQGEKHESVNNHLSGSQESGFNESEIEVDCSLDANHHNKRGFKKLSQHALPVAAYSGDGESSPSFALSCRQNNLVCDMSETPGAEISADTHESKPLAQYRAFVAESTDSPETRSTGMTDLQEMKTNCSDHIQDKAKPPESRKKRRVIPTLISEIN